MKKVLTFAIFLLTLLPLCDISGVATVKGQRLNYENGEGFFSDLYVDSTNEKCDICGRLYDPDEGHTCKFQCECCQQWFEDLDYHLKYDLACKNCQGGKDNDPPIDGMCYFCSQPIDYCTCSGGIGIGNRPSPGGGGSSGSGSGGGGGNPVIGNSGYNKYGQTFTYDDLKWKNVTTINNLPHNPPKQVFPNECVIVAAALMASIETGKDYEDMRFDLLNYCLCAGMDVRGSYALSLQDVKDVLYLAIDVKQESFNTSSIENSLNNNHPVLALVSTGEYVDYITMTELSHMVTIVGYDYFYYYCAIGEENKYTAIPKSNFKKDFNIFRIK